MHINSVHLQEVIFREEQIFALGTLPSLYGRLYIIHRNIRFSTFTEYSYYVCTESFAFTNKYYLLLYHTLYLYNTISFSLYNYSSDYSLI